MKYEHINADKNLYCVDKLPLVTIYDDNWYVRNDYDLLSYGQRNYLIKFFEKWGARLVSGRQMKLNHRTIEFPRPQANLAVSAFERAFIEPLTSTLYCVTPTQFAQALFYQGVSLNFTRQQVIERIRQLIDKCPYNIEWLRDISYRSPIESLTAETYLELTEYQKQVVNEKFKRKRAL
ncbi:hypothetical protein [Thalassotalea ganghwensis]